MSLSAIAFVKIPYADLCAIHDIPPVSTGEAIESMSTFVPVGSDATACLLDAPYASDPRELALDAWQIIGDDLDRHDDARGLFIAPEKGLKDAPLTSYDAAIAHYGDAGHWVPRLSAAEARAALVQTPNPLEAMLGGSFASTLASIQSQLGADPRMAGALGDVAAGATPGSDLFEMAQQMLAQMSPDQQAQLEQMAKAMFGSVDPNAPKAPHPAAEDDDDPEFGGGDEPEPKKG